MGGQYGDNRTGAWGAAQDQLVLGGVVLSGASGMRQRMMELQRVANGQLRPNPESRLGAFAATTGYPRGTVGNAVNNAIGVLYLQFGTYGEERIGTVFNSPAAQAHYNNPVDGPSSRAVAQMEYNYWRAVRNEDPWSPGSNIATAFNPTTRDWLQRNVFDF